MTSSGELLHHCFEKYSLCPLFSLALHPERSLVATGQIGKEPFVCVWDSVSLKTVSILQGGHERGVAAIAFSGDGKVKCINSFGAYKAHRIPG